MRERLLALEQRDLALRARLQAEGGLSDGYHPLMEAVHRENAQALRELIARVGWPHEPLAGADGAQAAWLVAQHAIGEPPFMRRCRDLLAAEAAAGRVPRWQHAYLDDRIRVFEGRPQRFGTQFEITPDGPAVYPVQAPRRLDERRRQAGLPPLQQRLDALQGEPRPTAQAYAERQAAGAAWRQAVGWLAAGPT